MKGQAFQDQNTCGFRADIQGNPYPLTDQKSSHLVIEEVKKDNAGRYCCRVMNKYNQDFSRWVGDRCQGTSRTQW